MISEKNKTAALLLLTIAAFMMITISAFIEMPEENHNTSISISETISITPTTIPTQEPTMTVESFSAESDINSLPLPKNCSGAFKAWESADSITRQDSKQWHLKQVYWFDSDGFARIGEYYAVAMGTYYAEYIGQTFEVELESRTIKVIIGDVKADKDCIDRMYCKINGSILEFIIKDGSMDSDKLNQIMAGSILRIAKEK